MPAHTSTVSTAVIFDLDGVIMDSQRLHAQVEHEMLLRRGIRIPATVISHRFAGVSMHEIFGTLFREHHFSGSVEDAIAEKRAGIDALPDTAFEPIPGAVELIRRLTHRSQTSLAVASASGIGFIQRMLRIARVDGYFDALASAQEVRHGKPAPDVFLLAAHRVRIHPMRCTVIEDGLSGMLAARAAGMRCIGFVTPERFREGVEYPAHVRCSSMDEIAALLLPAPR